MLTSFFKSFALHPTRTLFLDYDGTLAPFHTDRTKAFPYAGVTELLEDLIAHPANRVVFVTGRGIDDLLQVLHLPKYPEIWGSHGWERLTADGIYTCATPFPQQQAGLQHASDAIDEAQLNERCERKPVGLTIHWRGISNAAAEVIRNTTLQRWQPLVQPYDLEIHFFDGGIELRATGYDKGVAVSRVLAEIPHQPTAYLGDDLTDEDGFRALSGRGLRVLVRPEHRESLADVWLKPPGELLGFLERWREGGG